MYEVYRLRYVYHYLEHKLAIARATFGSCGALGGPGTGLLACERTCLSLRTTLSRRRVIPGAA